jgi:hypothetical protein
MIKVIRLVGGDDVIAEIVQNENSTTLKNAQRLVMTHEGLGSMPFMLFSKDKEFVISNSHIIAIGEPDDEIRNSYSAQNGGIVLAKNNMVITE